MQIPWTHVRPAIMDPPACITCVDVTIRIRKLGKLRKAPTFELIRWGGRTTEPPWICRTMDPPWIFWDHLRILLMSDQFHCSIITGLSRNLDIIPMLLETSKRHLSLTVLTILLFKLAVRGYACTQEDSNKPFLCTMIHFVKGVCAVRVFIFVKFLDI